MKKNLKLINILEQGPFQPASAPEVGYSTDDDIKSGSIWSGDFDSNASKQSWTEFAIIYFAGGLFGAPIAVGRELSSWHGKRELIRYQHPWQIIPELKGELPIPENYDVWLIRGGMKASDFIDNVQYDKNGFPYYEYKSFEQSLKLYLPSSKFFDKYNGMPYKFKTEEGITYSLILDLVMEGSAELQVGSDKTKDTDFVISLQNLKPDEGNGWFFKPPIEMTPNRFEYFTKIGSEYYDYSSETWINSSKSSFQLFWEKWGIIVQIVASIIIAYFTAGLSAFIVGIFEGLANAEALAGGAGVFTRIFTWLTTEGAFVATRSLLLAEFLLELAVNIPAALIDNMYGNKFGAILGIFFSFFPFIRSYGKLGRFIEGTYDEATINSLVSKIMKEGFGESTTPEQMIKFIETLTAEEKMAWASGLKALSKQEGAQAFKETLEDTFKKLASDGKLMSEFDSWLAGGKYSGFLKTTVLSVSLMGDLTGIHHLIEGIKALKKDPRSLEEIFFDTESEVEEIKKKFPLNEKDGFVKTKKTEDIIKDYIVSLGEKEGASKVYELSKKTNERFFIDLVANEKIKETKGNIAEYKKYGDKTQEAIQKLLEANKNKTTPLQEEEIYSWFESGDADEEVKNVLSTFSDEEFSSELSGLVSKHKCLATNFKYDDGYDYFDDAGQTNWVLSFEVTKPITITGVDISKLNLSTGDFIHIYNNNSFMYKDKKYPKFSCS
jgi:hypothetical protein